MQSWFTRTVSSYSLRTPPTNRPTSDVFKCSIFRRSLHLLGHRQEVSRWVLVYAIAAMGTTLESE